MTHADDLTDGVDTCEVVEDRSDLLHLIARHATEPLGDALVIELAADGDGALDTAWQLGLTTGAHVARLWQQGRLDPEVLCAHADRLDQATRDALWREVDDDLRGMIEDLGGVSSHQLLDALDSQTLLDPDADTADPAALCIVGACDPEIAAAGLRDRGFDLRGGPLAEAVDHACGTLLASGKTAQAAELVAAACVPRSGTAHADLPDWSHTCLHAAFRRDARQLELPARSALRAFADAWDGPLPRVPDDGVPERTRRTWLAVAAELGADHDELRKLAPVLALYLPAEETRDLPTSVARSGPQRAADASADHDGPTVWRTIDRHPAHATALLAAALTRGAVTLPDAMREDRRSVLTDVAAAHPAAVTAAAHVIAHLTPEDDELPNACARLLDVSVALALDVRRQLEHQAADLVARYTEALAHHGATADTDGRELLTAAGIAVPEPSVAQVLREGSPDALAHIANDLASRPRLLDLIAILIGSHDGTWPELIATAESLSNQR